MVRITSDCCAGNNSVSGNSLSGMVSAAGSAMAGGFSMLRR